MNEFAPVTEKCEACRVREGNVVTVRRAGVVVWQRMLCAPCFDEYRAGLTTRGLVAVPVVEA